VSDGEREPTKQSAARRAPLADAIGARRRAQLVTGLRGFLRDSQTGGHGRAPGEMPTPPADALRTPAGAPGPPVGAPNTLVLDTSQERCDLCATTIPAEHRHLLNLVERRIECVCESCWALRSGEAEFRPTGSRTLWLPELDLPAEVWAGFQIPIGLAFFMESTVAGCVVALYPSPAGATESELRFESWSRLVALNPVLTDLEPDVEGLIANRLDDPPAYAIAPIDRCYALTGAVRMSWEGISGGDGVGAAVGRFFDELRTEAIAT
jgi:Family of unknown function (DUF5947)